jgi:hypothetical protein
MRYRHSSPTKLLFLLSLLLLVSATARADDDNNNGGDEYEEHGRVLRVSLLKGEVTLQRAGSDEWETAQLNSPLVEGDTLATGRDARLEIQADSRNFIRVGENSVLKVVTLRDEGIALSLSEGTATFKLSRFDRDKEYFELDAPKTTVAAERTGQYRVDCDASSVSVTVREGGRARIYTETSGFELGSERTARLALNGEADDWDVGAAAQLDGWDSWNVERELYIASRLDSEGSGRYYDSDVYGAEELDAYGDWQYTNDYGYVWSPSASYISGYDNWAPYRYGSWDWCPPYGWTWVASEPWGWAPYHYGRWVFFNNRWCWAPRGYGYNYRRAWWRPALVAFTTVDFGGERRVCWYPLTYGQRDPRGRWWTRRLDPVRGVDVDKHHRMSPALLRAVSFAPAGRFGDRNFRARPAGDEIARRAVESEPLRGRLPFEPHGGRGSVGSSATNGTRTTDANGRSVLVINRPAPVMPPRFIPDRTTGAAPRSPGVPLDRQLRRSRLSGGHSPRFNPPQNNSGSERNGFDHTGTRRELTGRQPTDSNNRATNTGRDTRAHRPDTKAHDNSSTPQRSWPTRTPAQPRPNEDGLRNDMVKANPAYKPQPRPSTPDEHPRPTSPREESRPERPAPRESPRYQPQPRQETPRQQTPRQESPRQERPASTPARGPEGSHLRSNH